MCAACPTPRLNQSYELRPPWEQHLRYVRYRVQNGYNNVLSDDGPVWPKQVGVILKLILICVEGFEV